MKRFITVLAIIAAVPSIASTKHKEPNFDSVLRINGRFSIAHACPIAPDLVLTSAHVIDPKPMDRTAGLLVMRFQSVKGDTAGFLDPIMAGMDIDVAFMEPTVAVAYYPRASKAPTKGETLYFLGYDYRKASVAYSPRAYSGEVVNVIAGLIIANVEGAPGASGGCVLNENSEVVGLTTGLSDMDNGSYVTVFDAVYGNWLDRMMDKLAEIKEAEAESETK